MIEGHYPFTEEYLPKLRDAPVTDEVKLTFNKASG
jgi:hypothetical protein